ncbi:hypothetical protein NC652_038597 [Populus alba x Populus x berolinensis]|uniref:Uncharacterized protein n=1 Tax=Populus alba x Populus x berolinensis TaxID=444605 RepID=A0AAD6LHE6_9ROSI|nr:hypothetical protein NC652_038597 [Populus alba x Populus x berolinensis]KAJ6960645.1 hypothetical protein NC653_038614 [Populus alba x Populus x berolinensis]
MGRYILFREKIPLTSKLKKNQTKYNHIWKNGPPLPLLFALTKSCMQSNLYSPSWEKRNKTTTL